MKCLRANKKLSVLCKLKNNSASKIAPYVVF